MNAEAQEYLRKAENVTNTTNKSGELHKATRIMTFQEREAKEAELKNLMDVLSPQNVAASSLSQEGRANMARYKNFLQRDLADNAPPSDINSSARDELVARERELAEQIREGMLPQEVMRRNPPGAVGHHIKWEKANKAKILAWKNLRRLANPDDSDEDLANIETLRPSLAGPGTPATFMADAQIPGKMTYNHIPDEKWKEAGLPLVNENSPFALAAKREAEMMERIALLEAQLKAKPQARQATEPKFKTPEQIEAARQRGIAVAARAKAAREAKKAAQSAEK
jgi:hypothetical protein